MKYSPETIKRLATTAIARGQRKGFNDPSSLGLLVTMALSNGGKKRRKRSANKSAN